MCGALCVMMDGAVLMPPWCVGSLDTSLKVRHFRFSYIVHLEHNSDRISCKQVSTNLYLVPGVFCLVAKQFECMNNEPVTSSC